MVPFAHSLSLYIYICLYMKLGTAPNQKCDFLKMSTTMYRLLTFIMQYNGTGFVKIDPKLFKL